MAVQLAGVGTDAEGAVTYAWSQVAGPTITLSNAAIANPTFIAPSAPIGQTRSVELRLTVRDSAGATASDTTVLTITSNDYLVYSAGQGGPSLPQPGVFVYHTENGSIATLAPPTVDASVSGIEIAPDRSHIAYTSSNPNIATIDVYTVRPDGSSPNKINAPLAFGMAVSNYGWSPDSSRIAYLADHDTRFALELYTTLSDGSGRVKINTALAANGIVFNWAWSPDSSRIAFTAQLAADSRPQLYIAGGDGSGLLRLSDAQTGLGVGGWQFSPDGTRLVYAEYVGPSRASVVYTIKPDGTERAAVFGPYTGTADARNWEWSPTSSHLVANVDPDTDQKYEAYANRADGTQLVKISATTSYSYTGFFAWQWTRDGSRIAIITDANNDRVTDLQSVSPDGASRVTLNDASTSAGGALGYSWSPDGTRMVSLEFRTPGGAQDLFTVLADGTGRVRLNDDLPPGGVVTGFPVWAPDSSRIAFSVEQNTAGVSELYVIRADGTQRAHVTTKPEPPTSAQWAPDGARLLYAKIDDATLTAELYTVLPDGTDPRRLTTPTATSLVPNNPMWSPDGAMLSYVQHDSALQPELHVVRADGTGNVQVNDTSIPSAVVFPFGWAP